MQWFMLVCSFTFIYIYRKLKMVVNSSHKALEMIFEKKLRSGPMRLQSMKLRLQNNVIKVQYKIGKLMYLDDALSQAFLQ